MIVKCISYKAKDAGNIVRYVMAEAKLQTKQSLYLRDLHIPGVVLTAKDIKHLNTDLENVKELIELKKENGDVNVFIEKQIEEAKKRSSNKGFDQVVITHNLRSRSINGWIKEFNENEKLRVHKRVNNTTIFHTVIAFSQKDKANLNPKILKDIAKQYISIRGPNSIYLAGVHQDKEHIHLHVLQSAVQYRTGIANRVSRQQFQEQKISMQEYQKQRYPELNHSVVEHKQGNMSAKNYKIPTAREREMEKRELEDILSSAIGKVKSLDELVGKLEENGHKAYYRNNSIQGVQFSSDRKYRFSTLGFKEAVKELEENTNRQREELKKLKEMRTQKGRSQQQSKTAQKERFENLTKKDGIDKPYIGELHIRLTVDMNKVCDDCKKEQADPSYDNPKYYTNGVFDKEKYEEHTLEETGLHSEMTIEPDENEQNGKQEEVKTIEDNDQEVQTRHPYSELDLDDDYEIDR